MCEFCSPHSVAPCVVCGHHTPHQQAVFILRRLIAAWEGRSGRLINAINDADEFLINYDDESVLNAANCG